MNEAVLVTYVLVGLVVGYLFARDVAEVNARRRDESDLEVGFAFLGGAIVWPLIVAFGAILCLGRVVSRGIE